jgi:hypothetical protein
MSDRDQSSDDSTPKGAEEAGISDDRLPDDLQPHDDNPLAKTPSDDEDDEGQGISLGPDGPQ